MAELQESREPRRRRSHPWRAAACACVLAAVLTACDSSGVTPVLTKASAAPASQTSIATRAPTPTPTPPPTVDQLLASLRDPTSAATRAWAAESLAQVQDPVVVPALVSALVDDVVPVRIAVAVSLGSLGDARGAKAVAAALQSELKAQPSSGFVPAACGALGQLGGTAGVAALIAVLGTTGETNRDAARMALTRIGAPAVPALERALSTGGRDQRLQVVNFLASLGSRGVKPLITALTNSDAKVRSAAANRLGHLGDRSAEKTLANVLDDRAMGLTASIALVRLFEKEPSTLAHYLRSTQTLRIYYGLMQVGAPETVDALASALLRLGDLDMAEDFLNCGEPTLEQAANDWADANGYQVVPSGGSSDMTWGSGLAE
jgi:HEAT repeat protein